MILPALCDSGNASRGETRRRGLAKLISGGAGDTTPPVKLVIPDSTGCLVPADRLLYNDAPYLLRQVREIH